MSARLFCVDRFTAEADISFYTRLPNYSTFMAIFDYLNPGDNCENIRPRSNVTDVPEDFYNSDSDEDDDVQKAKKGRRRKLKTLDEFFIVLCRLRRGFPERHLAHLYGLAQSTVSRIFIPWINLAIYQFGPPKQLLWKQCQLISRKNFHQLELLLTAQKYAVKCPAVSC